MEERFPSKFKWLKYLRLKPALDWDKPYWYHTDVYLNFFEFWYQVDLNSEHFSHFNNQCDMDINEFA